MIRWLCALTGHVLGRRRFPERYTGLEAGTWWTCACGDLFRSSGRWERRW